MDGWGRRCVMDPFHSHSTSRNAPLSAALGSLIWRDLAPYLIGRAFREGVTDVLAVPLRLDRSSYLRLLGDDEEEEGLDAPAEDLHRRLLAELINQGDRVHGGPILYVLEKKIKKIIAADKRTGERRATRRRGNVVF